jgi:hypothetical protein
MATSITPGRSTTDRGTDGTFSRGVTERRTTETKAAFKTTEFFAYLATLAGVLIAGLIVDNDDPGGFGAQQVWLYATILTVGYMLARGHAKSGSRDPYTHERDDR